MSKEQFQHFLKSHHGTEVDWSQRTQDWLAAIERLFSLAEAWLGEFEADGVSWARAETELLEPGLGAYRAPVMRIGLLGVEVRLEPVGTIIVGARGRVDVVGFAGSTRLLLVAPDAERPEVILREAVARTDTGAAARAVGATSISDCVWKLATPPPAIRFVDLTQELFLQAIMQAVNARPA